MANRVKYKSEYCQLLVKHLEEGLSYQSFAGVVGVHKETLYAWEKKYKHFKEAKKRGLAKSLLYWERMGRAMAAGTLQKVTGKDKEGNLKKEATTGNVHAWKFHMKNRFGWRDRTELSGDPKRPLTKKEAVHLILEDIDNLSDEDMERIVNTIRSERESIDNKNEYSEWDDYDYDIE